MDFSRIPFNGALDRLSHLATMGVLLRLQSVQPQLQHKFPRRRFYSIETNRTADGPPTLTFGCPLNPATYDYSTIYDAPEWVLNEGAVECTVLLLHRLDHRLPYDAIRCFSAIVIDVAERGILSFIDSRSVLKPRKDGLPQENGFTLMDCDMKEIFEQQNDF